MLVVPGPCQQQREMQGGRMPCTRPPAPAPAPPPAQVSAPTPANSIPRHHHHYNNSPANLGGGARVSSGLGGGGKRTPAGNMASAAPPYRAPWGPAPPATPAALRFPPPPQQQQQNHHQPQQQQQSQQQTTPTQNGQAGGGGGGQLQYVVQHQMAPAPSIAHTPHTQYTSGRVPTAASPSNTTSSSSSATGSQSGTMSTSLSNNTNNGQQEQLSRTNLYIRGLSQSTSDKDLVSMCQQYGTIISTKAILDKNTNKCKGYGFVDFENVSSAEAAVKGLQAKGIQAQMAKVGIWLLHRPNSQQEQDPTNLYMANLPLHFKENDMDNLLARFGQVVSTRILRDPFGQSKGVGFARMESRDKCEQIIQMFNGNPLPGGKEPLLVKFADGGNKKKTQYKTPDRTWRESTDSSHSLLCSVGGTGPAVYGCGTGADLGGVYRGGVYMGGYPVAPHWVPAAYPVLQPAHPIPAPHIDEQYAMQVSRGDRAMGLVLPEAAQQYPAPILPHALQLAPPQYLSPAYGYTGPSIIHALPIEPDHSTAASPDESYQQYATK